jgi:hypothetical protein
MTMAGVRVLMQIGPHFEKPSRAGATRVVPHGGNMHAWRACRAAFSATAAGAFLFVLRNSFGTWNVPNFSCRAKTL